MALSRSETDAAMLSDASKSDNQNTDYMSQTILNRGTESVHPISCLCKVCTALRYENSQVNEVQVKEDLGYFIGDADS